MIPQLIVAIWLTAVWSYNVRWQSDGFDITCDMFSAGAIIAIPATALYYAGFWTV